MAKIYATPDFDVTSYDINDVITFEGEIGPGDADGWDPSNPGLGDLV